MHRSALTLLLPLALALATTQCARTSNDADPPAAEGEEVLRVPVDGLPVLGNEAAPVTIVAFTDYECPYCAKLDETLAQVRSAYGERVRVALASLPLPMHERAQPAARAMLAAAEQGRAAAMHARLFEATRARRPLGDDELRDAARAIGLDLDAFDAARTGPSTAAALARATNLASSLHVTATPTLFVNGRKIEGARPLATLTATLDEELAKAERLGVPARDVYRTILSRAATAPRPAPPPPVDELGANANVSADGAPIRGDLHAPVTMVVFGDLECAYCMRLDPTIHELLADYPGKLRVAYRHLPLPMHAHARLAAKAAVAAQEQGAFWAFHDRVVASPYTLDRATLEQHAKALALDPARFVRDMDDPKTEERVAADEAQARALGVRGTPTVIIGGIDGSRRPTRIVGAHGVEVYRAEIDRALSSLARAHAQ